MNKVGLDLKKDFKLIRREFPILAIGWLFPACFQEIIRKERKSYL